MSDFPRSIRVSYTENRSAGLVAVVSADLPGLMTVATSLQEAEERTPRAIAQIIHAQYGVQVSVTRHEDDGTGGFSAIGERVMELHAA